MSGHFKCNEIIRVLQEHKSEIRSFGVTRLGLFGSFARGDAREDSDLDFLVDMEKKTFRAYMGLKFFLEELFGRKVDLIMRGAMKQRFRENILDETIYAAVL